MYRQFNLRNNRSGFSTIEILFSLCITLTIVFNTSIIISSVKKSTEIDPILPSISLGAYQIANTLHTATYKTISNTLTYEFNDTEYTISLNENRVVKQPGFTIYMSNIDNLYFTQDSFNVYMHVEYLDYNTSFLIGTSLDEVY